MTGQMQLCAVAVDERTLDDTRRTVLEAIDHLGTITAQQAGVIAYRLRGWHNLILVPGAWLTSSGRRVLDRLERDGLVRRARRGRWQRASSSFSDLIGPSEARAVVARCGQIALERARGRGPRHPADIPANRGIPGYSGATARARVEQLEARGARDDVARPRDGRLVVRDEHRGILEALDRGLAAADDLGLVVEAEELELPVLVRDEHDVHELVAVVLLEEGCQLGHRHGRATYACLRTERSCA